MTERRKLAILAVRVVVMLCLIIYLLPHRKVAASPTGMIPVAPMAQLA